MHRSLLCLAGLLLVAGCSHDEPECALDGWVASGHSDPARLASLRRLLRSRDQEEEPDRALPDQSPPDQPQAQRQDG